MDDSSTTTNNNWFEIDIPKLPKRSSSDSSAARNRPRSVNIKLDKEFDRKFHMMKLSSDLIVKEESAQDNGIIM